MTSKNTLKNSACFCFLMIFLLMFSACKHSSANAAVFIYSADDVNRKNPVATITWDDKDKLTVINNMINELYGTAGEMTEEVPMSYIIEFVNSDVDNDIFEIGIDGERICGSGAIQGVSIDKSYTTSITSDDFMGTIQ